MMESLLLALSSPEAWQRFLAYKTEKHQLRKSEIRELQMLMSENRYLSVTESMPFPYPVRRELMKLGSSKKRVVYSYGKDQTWVLKHLAFLLFQYDHVLSERCYSFRRHKTPGMAFREILQLKSLDSRYVLKLDIHDYFNSIDPVRLLGILKEVLQEDPPLFHFMEELLTQDRCFKDGALIKEKRGAMAGVPLSGFFADLYLRELDRMFEEGDAAYFRYSDDMIFFFPDMDALEEGFAKVKAFLEAAGLSLNMKKFRISRPGEPWEFLGFSYAAGRLELSETSILKMKGKIRRKARKLRLKMDREGLGFDRAAASMIRSFDHKFYDLSGTNDFTWTRFYFPLLTGTEGLHQIDLYMLEYLRFLYSGRHYKGNYRVSYSRLKSLGYTPLVAEYHRWKKENMLLEAANRQAGFAKSDRIV